MGHRTLVAYDRAGYDLHYAHWGVDPEDLTPETPFGGPPDVAGARRSTPDCVDPVGGRLTDDRRTSVEPDPIATGLAFSEVCSYVDPVEHEALFVVDAEFHVRTYLVFALRSGSYLGPDDPDGSNQRDDPDASGSRRATAALVGYDDPTDAAYLRGWLAGARAVRDVADEGDDAVVRALRWLDPARGTLLWLAGHERGDDRTPDGERDDRSPPDGRDA